MTHESTTGTPLTEEVKCCLKVALALPVTEAFNYAVPDHLVSGAEVGCRVMVPFRNRNVTGYILEKIPVDQGHELKEIIEVLDGEPLFHKGIVPFFQWMADYYLYPLGRLIQAALPGGLNASTVRTGELTDKGLKALKFLGADSEKGKALGWMKDNPGKRIPYSLLNLATAFQRKGWLSIEVKTRRGRVRPLIKHFVRPRQGVEPGSVLKEGADSLKAGGEAEFLRAVLNSEGIPLSELCKRFPNGSYLVRKWVGRGVLESYRAAAVRDPAGHILFPSPVPPRLYDQQQNVLSVIRNGLDKKHFSVCLLHGVTGSGKTEVYYEAIRHAVRLGRQALLMVPEIALAIYMESTFRSRLGDRVAIFHSGLGGGERFDQWMRMMRGEVDLVIGARSALFAPLPALGLIIVDEEHDSSYKQEEAPRYQARDAAVARGKIEKALVLLGSGTPSVQSYHHALTGRYQLLSMPERIEKRPLPSVRIIDMKTIPEGDKSHQIISPALRESLDKNLREEKQIMLFLNRRGFNRVYLCRFCGQSIRCPNCDLALIYHLKEARLACHYCEFHAQPQGQCPSCGKEGMRAYGFGTERLESHLKDLFPERRTARMDRDSIRRKGEIFRILKRFGDREVDILVGTQMITKGYDFPSVTLVGVIGADSSLLFPDFRAAERTFQVLSQVAGRAGRGDHSGEVIIQTFNPGHYAITSAKDHDYPTFYKQEIALREVLGYPPFSYMACLRFQGNRQAETADRAHMVGRVMHQTLNRWPRKRREIQVLGPAEAPLSKLRGKYRWQILVKSKGSALLHYFLREVDRISRRGLNSSGVTLSIDVDPYQML